MSTPTITTTTSTCTGTGTGTGTRDLSALFAPAGIVVIGASADPAKWGGAIARQALRGPRHRPVHLVNRRGGQILGQSAWVRATEIGEPVDLAVICVPATAFDEALDDALDVGARAIVAITAGFGETGAEGLARQQAAVDRVRAAGGVLVGPNCLGLVDNTTGLYLASDPFDAGSVALLSQSGNLALELGLRLRRRAAGFSRFVSLGNQADVTLAELVDDCARHDGTETIAVYAEDFADGRAFAEAAARSPKPVVLLTAGRGAASARGALSHTGAMTTPADVIAAVCRDAGIHQASTPRELATVLTALGTGRRAAGRRIAVLTDGGGHGALAADAVEAAGLRVPELSAPLQAELMTGLWEQSATGNPIDLAGMGEQEPASYATTASALVDAPELDGVLLTGYFGGYSADRSGPEAGQAPAAGSAAASGLGGGLGDGEIAAAHRIAALHAGSDRPFVVQSMYPDSPSCTILADAGIPVFDAIEDAARALAAVCADAPAGTPATAPAPATRRVVRALPPARTPLAEVGYFAVRDLLSGHGLSFPAAVPAADGAQVLAAADTLTGPFVLKAVHLLHKSDAGGVALGLRGQDALAAAWGRMDAVFSDSPVPPAYSVEEMADLRDSVELIVGVRRDPRFGPVVMVGLGGIATETLKDTAFALAPIAPDAAELLLRSLRSSALFDELRGRPALDLAAAAEAVCAVARAAAEHPEIAELEVNPVLLSPRGVLALDARAVLA